MATDNKNKAKIIKEILQKYYAKINAIEKAKLKIVKDIKEEQTEKEIEDVRKKLQEL